MKLNQMKSGLSFALVLMSCVALADRMDRPVGIKIGERMTLKPYVSASISYDSNVDSMKDGTDDVMWVINPALSLEYKAENWLFFVNGWYQYNGYFKGDGRNQRSNHNYGEDLMYRWTDSLPGEKGWSVMLAQKFIMTDQLEDYEDIGRQYSNDRTEFKIAGGLERRFSHQGFHADVNANYYWLDYDNNNNQGVGFGLYGWQRWGVGLEVGYALSSWTDILIAGGYQRYESDNRKNNAYQDFKDYGRAAGSESWTVQGGIGSYATDHISYRVLAGLSTYSYDHGGNSTEGFSYSASANWEISQTWKTMFVASSSYQPTEREFGSSQRVDALSWGLSHSMVQGKLHGNLDLSYRREGREYSATQGYDYDLDVLSGRLGFTYILNRYLQFFSSFEYRQSFCEDSDSERGDFYAYDKYRLTIGARLTY